MNGQPWHFIVVDDQETLHQLGSVARTGPYVAQAPLAIVVAIQKTKFAVADASRAIQCMVLTAWSEGIGSNWVGFFGLDDVKPILGIPNDVEVLAIIPFGIRRKLSVKGKRTGNRFRKLPIMGGSGNRLSLETLTLPFPRGRGSGGVHNLWNICVELFQNGLAISADPEMVSLVAAQRHRVDKVVK